MMAVRPLSDVDAPALLRFLAEHAESSTFLSSNVRAAGIDYHGQRFGGEYLGAFGADGAITGVIAHYWIGNILMQAPEPAILAALVSGLMATISRPVLGVLGPLAQADAVIEALALPRHGFTVDSEEKLFALDLSDLRVPARVGRSFRRAGPGDTDLLRRWLKAYEIEAIGRADDDELERLVEGQVAHKTGGADCWLLEADESPLSLSGFNARLPDILQVGPVYTPKERRGQGHARLLVGLTLQAARDQGVRKAVLFTNVPSAIHAYEALGFQVTCGYRMALLKAPFYPTALAQGR
jgi:GNAT superfamily N-acetyltransferase